MSFKFTIPSLEDLDADDEEAAPVVFVPKKAKLSDTPEPPINQPASTPPPVLTSTLSNNRPITPPQAAPGFIRASSFPPKQPIALPQTHSRPTEVIKPPEMATGAPKPTVRNPSAQQWKPASTTLTINERQRANPMVKHIRSVRYEFNSHISADFVMTSNSCAVFLSVKYHLLHPEYITKRIADLPGKFGLRVLLVLVDEEHHGDTILQLNKLAIEKKMTLILTWSNREAAQYIEAYNSFENKSVDALKEKTKEDLFSQAVDCFTQIRHISAPNVVSLLQHFGSVKNIVLSSLEQLSLIPGLGETKVKRLHETFNRPFSAALQQQRRSTQATVSTSVSLSTPKPPASETGDNGYEE